MDFVCPATVVAQALSSLSNIETAGNGESFAVVKRLDGGELVGVGLDGLSELDHQLATNVLKEQSQKRLAFWLRRAYTGSVETPCGVVRLLGSLDGLVNIFGVSLRDLADFLAGRRVGDLAENRANRSAKYREREESTNKVLPDVAGTNSLLMKHCA